MAEKKLKITVGKTGDIRMAAIGTQGAECIALMKPLADALGDIQQAVPTDDMYREQELVQVGAH